MIKWPNVTIEGVNVPQSYYKAYGTTCRRQKGSMFYRLPKMSHLVKTILSKVVSLDSYRVFLSTFVKIVTPFDALEGSQMTEKAKKAPHNLLCEHVLISESNRKRSSFPSNVMCSIFRSHIHSTQKRAYWDPLAEPNPLFNIFSKVFKNGSPIGIHILTGKLISRTINLASS
jgi:hypothetical protein